MITAASVLALVPGLPAQAAGLNYLSTIGGPGHSQVYPSGMEVGPAGEVVLADTGNDSVVKFDANGNQVWRVASGGASSTGGTTDLDNARDLGVDSVGNVYVADDANFRIVKLDGQTGLPIGKPWTGAAGDRIGSPIGVSVHRSPGGQELVYVADGAKKKVRVFNTSGVQLRTFSSPGGACTFAALRDVDADSAGNVYIANYTNNNIVKLDPQGNCIGSWGTKGTLNGQFKNPYGVRVAIDPTWGESVYVADSNNNRAQVFSLDGTWRASLGSTGDPSLNGSFRTVRRVAVAANGDVWLADLWGWKAERFRRTSTGYVAGAQRIGNGAPPLTSTSVFNEPRAVAFAPDGSLQIVDTVNQRIVHFSTGGTVLSACGERSSLPVSPNWPRGAAIDPSTGDIWLADTKQSRIQIWQPNCKVVARVGTLGAGTNQLNWPYSIAIRGSDRTAFLADTKNNRVVAWDVATRTQLAAFGSLGSGVGQFNSPRGVSVAPNGNLYVADTVNNRVVELSFNATTKTFTFVRVVPVAGLNRPEGVAADAAGRVWIADTGDSQVVVTSTSGTTLGTITTAAGLAVKGPAAISIAADGKAYISDTQNDRVLVYSYS